MYGIKVRQQDVGWTPLEFSGVAMKVLFKDEATGAMAVITRMEAGAVIPAHFHSKADETVFVLEGQFVEDDESYGPGSYFVGKAGSPHGPHGTPSGCSVLTHFSCEPDFQSSEVSEVANLLHAKLRRCLLRAKHPECGLKVVQRN